MEEIKKKLILKLLISQCNDGSYKILEKNELISLLPQKYKVTENEFSKIIEHLENEDFLSVRYEDEQVICLCLLQKAYSFQEIKQNIKEKDKEKQNSFPYPFFILIFFLTLLASFISSLLAKLINF